MKDIMGRPLGESQLVAYAVRAFDRAKLVVGIIERIVPENNQVKVRAIRENDGLGLGRNNSPYSNRLRTVSVDRMVVIADE